MGFFKKIASTVTNEVKHVTASVENGANTVLSKTTQVVEKAGNIVNKVPAETMQAGGQVKNFANKAINKVEESVNDLIEKIGNSAFNALKENFSNKLNEQLSAFSKINYQLNDNHESKNANELEEDSSPQNNGVLPLNDNYIINYHLQSLYGNKEVVTLGKIGEYLDANGIEKPFVLKAALMFGSEEEISLTQAENLSYTKIDYIKEEGIYDQLYKIAYDHLPNDNVDVNLSGETHSDL